jgi:L-lactate dehydrogenase complex protein LldG
MKAQTAAKKGILGSIRAGNADVHAAGYSALSREYRRVASLPREECIALMIERLREYDAVVVQCVPDNLLDTIAAQLAASGRKKFVAPAGLRPDWMAAGFEWRQDRESDRGLSQDDVEAADGVVTACYCGIAESGTIVLHHGPEEGRRILTLLPDWHLCVLRESQIVEVLPEYFARVANAPKLATYISGPSATADIEMTRIKGVHGPRLLHVVLVQDVSGRDGLAE